MWLTRILFAHRYRSAKVPGLQFTGKNRRHRRITRYMIRNTEKRLSLEEANERYLSMPFLTLEEEYKHASERRAKHAEEFLNARRFTSVPPHRYMDDHFSYLRISRKWES